MGRNDTGFLYNSFISRRVAGKEWLILTSVWLLIALFEFIQDMVSAFLNSGYLDLSGSLIFKLFWLIFIPLNFILIKYFKWISIKASKTNRYVFLILLVIIVSALHLFLFALSLSVYSEIVHISPWSLGEMVVLKLSSRMYIVLAVNTLLTLYLVRSSDRQEKGYREIIKVRSGRKARLVPAREIRWITADSGYLALHTASRRYLFSGSLKALSEELDPQCFRRVHKSTIVNLNAVQEFKSRMNGDYDILLDDGTELRLSRNYAGQLKGKWI